MPFYSFIFSPKLYKEYGDGAPQELYTPVGFEKWGDQIITTLTLMWNISYYTSPLILTFLYRRGYFVAESISSILKLSTGIGIFVAISLCMRGFGRSQSRTYVKFSKALENSKTNVSSKEEAKRQLRMYDFDFKEWPVDFSVSDVDGDKSKNRRVPAITSRNKTFWVTTLPCEVLAYVAMHTFGIRMIYPGSVKLVQSYLQPMLIQGRRTLVEEEHGLRYKVKTKDNNDIDTCFVDNRNNSGNGKILVICSEGNAGFYEIGIMSTPLSLKYSVLGWNHPGFGGSTGKPYPNEDQNAIDAIMLFSIYKLGFLPENIILFGWSIGGYSSLWAATRYPEIKGVILDATFDDILHLALPRMPESLSGIVRIAIRDYVNLHNNELITQYDGPILMIRRTEDEVICSEDMNLATNRGNFLLINLLKYRFPNIFSGEQIIYVKNLLSKTLETNVTSNDQLQLSLLMTYISENQRKYPLNIGTDYTDEQKNQMAEYLVRKQFVDFKSSHCTPLPTEYFKIPWDIPNDIDFVFT